MQNISKLSAIVAMSENHVIGNNNQLPWHLPADLKHFKTLTSGHTIIMGRKTHEAIGRALPQRFNIVITHNKHYQAKDCVVVHSLDEALTHQASAADNELFIIGGEQIYRLALPYIQCLYLTIVHQTITGDAYFPELNLNEWQEISRETHPADEQHAVAFSFVTLQRQPRGITQS